MPLSLAPCLHREELKLAICKGDVPEVYLEVGTCQKYLEVE